MTIFKVTGGIYYGGTSRAESPSINELVRLIEGQGPGACHIETNICCRLKLKEKVKVESHLSIRISLYTWDADIQAAWLKELNEKRQLTLTFESFDGPRTARIFEKGDEVFCEIT